jgi:hypothetical protein
MKTELAIPKTKSRCNTMANATEPEGDPREGYEKNEELRRAAAKQRATRERERQTLNLQRENILSQRTSHPARRAGLEAALAQIESQIIALG